MPYINIKVAGKLNREQKEQITREVVDTMFRIAKKPKDYTYIVFEEIPPENWAVGEHLLA